MKIYIAGSSKDIDRCELWRDHCVRVGMTITEDWMAEMRATPNDHLLDEERLVACANADRLGVVGADFVWLLAPPVSKPSAGCWSELAWAIERRVPVVYSPPDNERPQFCIFTTLIEAPGRLFQSDLQAFEFLVKQQEIIR